MSVLMPRLHFRAAYENNQTMIFFLQRGEAWLHFKDTHESNQTDNIFLAMGENDVWSCWTSQHCYSNIKILRESEKPYLLRTLVDGKCIQIVILYYLASYISSDTWRYRWIGNRPLHALFELSACTWLFFISVLNSYAFFMET